MVLGQDARQSGDWHGNMYAIFLVEGKPLQIQGLQSCPWWRNFVKDPKWCTSLFIKPILVHEIPDILRKANNDQISYAFYY